MRYLKDSLEPGERPLCRTHLHPIYMVSALLWLAILAGIGWTADHYLWQQFGRYIPPYELSYNGYRLALEPGFLGWLFTAGGAMLFLGEYIKFISTDLVMTSKRLLYKTGWIRVKLDATDLVDILGVHINQGWFGQFFGYGRLHLDCRFIADVDIPYVRSPYGIAKHLQESKAALTHPAPPPATVPVQQPVSQTLIQITGSNPVYIVDKVPNDPTPPLRQLPKALGENMLNSFKTKA